MTLSLIRCTATVALATGLGAGGGAALAQEVTVVLPEQPANLEPCRSIRSDIARVINMNITETLTIIQAETGEITPHLATEWAQVDETTWRFGIREGVEFQDGAPLNAEAVAYSINRLMNPALTCDTRSKFGDVTLTTDVVDEYTLDIKTDEPLPIMPTLVGTIQVHSPNLPFDEEVNEPIGTGPYTLAEADSEHIVLQRHDGYWGEQPAVTEAKYVWRNESAIRAAMIETGEADLTPTIAVQDATNPETDFAYLNSETTRMRIDMSIPPLDDVRVREALNLAIDWDGMGEALFGPDIKRATQMVVEGVQGYNPDIVPYVYDPKRAKALIEEARADGVPVDTEITLIGRNGFFPNSSESLEAMQALWSEIGLNVTIEELEAIDWARYLDKPFPADRGPTLFQQQHDNNTGDAGFTVPVLYLSGGQYSTVANTDLDQIINEAVITPTGEERVELFQQAVAKIYEEIIGDVTMYHMIGYARVGPRLDWRPDLKTNSEIRLADIEFK